MAVEKVTGIFKRISEEITVLRGKLHNKINDNNSVLNNNNHQ